VVGDWATTFLNTNAGKFFLPAGLRAVYLNAEDGVFMRGKLDKVGRELSVALSRKFGPSNVRRKLGCSKLLVENVRLAESGTKHMVCFEISECEESSQSSYDEVEGMSETANCSLGVPMTALSNVAYGSKLTLFTGDFAQLLAILSGGRVTDDEVYQNSSLRWLHRWFHLKVFVFDTPVRCPGPDFFQWSRRLDTGALNDSENRVLLSEIPCNKVPCDSDKQRSERLPELLKPLLSIKPPPSAVSQHAVNLETYGAALRAEIEWKLSMKTLELAEALSWCLCLSPRVCDVD